MLPKSTFEPPELFWFLKSVIAFIHSSRAYSVWRGTALFVYWTGGSIATFSEATEAAVAVKFV